MKAYVITTGSIFALLTVMHVWRLIEEGRQLATNPWWIFITLAAAGLAVWAAWLLRVAARPSAGEP
jgi:H+/Cl- antiporter ClcA